MMEKGNPKNNSDGSSVASTSSGATQGKTAGRGKASTSKAVLDEEFDTQFEKGATVLVIYRGRWLLAKVIGTDKSEHPEKKGVMVQCYHIHYPKWGKKHDEWVMPDSMMLSNTENQKKADEENAEHDAKNPALAAAKSKEKKPKVEGGEVKAEAKGGSQKPSTTKKAVPEQEKRSSSTTESKEPAIQGGKFSKNKVRQNQENSGTSHGALQR